VNKRPQPEGRRNPDERSEAVTPLPRSTRTSITTAAGRPNLPVAMPEPEETPLPYGISRGGLLAVGTSFLISLCLVGYGAGTIMAVVMRVPVPMLSSGVAPIGCSPFLAVLVSVRKGSRM
jgi:hypothetical protein